ncbi:MAG: polysaccharide lyase 6 family protein [Spirochaetales bacterium]|nr:polysaccharide lyase 6 family protein [Spirochaetales bacterium]
MSRSLPLLFFTSLLICSCTSLTGGSESRFRPENYRMNEETRAYEKPLDYDLIATGISDLRRKIASASPGDVIALQNGTYKNVDLDIRKNGIVVTAETSGAVFMEGTSTVTISGDNIVFEGFTFRNGRPSSSKGAIVVEGSGNRVTNCKIDSFNDSDRDNNYKWISLDNDSTYCEVDHCTFTGKRTEGALLVVWRDSTKAQHHHIYRNVFTDYQYVPEEDIRGDKNGWETIRIGTSTYSQSASHTTVEYNYFYDCNGEIEIISNKSCRNTYRYNTFESCAGMLTLRQGNNCTVEGNYFFIDDKYGGGIRIIDQGHRVSNNYIEGAASASKSRGGITISSHQTDPVLAGYRMVQDVTISGNSIINSRQSFNYGANGNENAPYSALISNNLIRNNIDGAGDYDYIRVNENDRGESLNIQNPVYSNNYFYGSSRLGFSPVPDGIFLEEVALTRNENGQYLAQDSSLGAPALERLSFSSSVGCQF